MFYISLDTLNICLQNLNDMNAVQFPLVKLPAKAELTLYLIKEELKSHKFFTGLRDIGLDKKQKGYFMRMEEC